MRLPFLGKVDVATVPAVVIGVAVLTLVIPLIPVNAQGSPPSGYYTDLATGKVWLYSAALATVTDTGQTDTPSPDQNCHDFHNIADYDRPLYYGASDESRTCGGDCSWAGIGDNNWRNASTIWTGYSTMKTGMCHVTDLTMTNGAQAKWRYENGIISNTTDWTMTAHIRYYINDNERGTFPNPNPAPYYIDVSPGVTAPPISCAIGSGVGPLAAKHFVRCSYLASYDLKGQAPTVSWTDGGTTFVAHYEQACLVSSLQSDAEADAMGWTFDQQVWLATKTLSTWTCKSWQ